MNTALPSFLDIERQELLTAAHLLDASTLPALDALVRLAARQTACSLALVNLVSQDAVKVLARSSPATHAIGDIEFQGSPCARVVATGASVLEHAQARALPGYPSWSYYAGVPIVVEHMVLGTVCVLDHQPPAPEQDVLACLRDVALAAGEIIHSQLALQRHQYQDVQHRQQTAEKLRVSEELYRCVAATISDGLLVVQLNGTLVAMNPAGARILGAAKVQTLAQYGQDLHIDFLQDDLVTPLPPAQRPWWHTIRTGQRVCDQVYPLRRADDTLAWIQLSCSLLSLGPNDLPFAVVATFRDITSERVAAHALARSEERWKFALEGAGDGVWDWAAGQGIAFHSSRWKTMLGFDEQALDEDIGDWSERVHPSERDTVVKAFNAYCHEGQGIFQAEVRMRHRLGHHIWMLWRGKVVRRDADGLPLRVVGTHSDITLLKEASRALQDKQAAEAANKAKSEFMSRMSHEIRTPLNAVRGFAQLLDRRLDPAISPQACDYVHQILISSELLHDLVNDVLDVQQIEAGSINIRPEAVVLADIVQLCATMLEPLIARYRVSLQHEVSPRWRVHGDRRRLAQVLSNLVSNAIKYNQPGGTVRVAVVEAPNHALALSVEDVGMGMNELQLSKLFQPFERLGRDTSSIEGTGLGLIITKSLVEAMGGRLEIRSQTGIGTCATVTLPQAEPSETVLADPLVGQPQKTVVTALSESSSSVLSVMAPHEASCSHDMPLRVMYVEDNRINMLLFEEAMRPFSELQLECAEDGAEALQLAQRFVPDVLVIDANLPGMSGLDVLRALRKLPQHAHTPAFMCSADVLPEDIQRAIKGGFDGYWTKPIDIQMVTNTLCQLAQKGRPVRVGR